MGEFELIKPLTGHSGCGLNLYKKDDTLFLRKDSGAPDYNRRLKKQYIKQNRFTLPGVKTPIIFKHGLENGLFYFDMEFLNGMTLAEYMPSIKIKEINSLISMLFKALPVKDSKVLPHTDKIFKRKIAEIKNKLRPSDFEAQEAIMLLENFDFTKVPSSYCCGDLTLENIMIGSNKEIYLIDFLDSFYNSWMIDVAKLLQDLDLHWSYRNREIDFNLAMRLAVAKEALLENIADSPEGQQNIYTIYHLLLLNILRIIPYTKDEHTAQFLKKALSKVINTIKAMERQA